MNAAVAEQIRSTVEARLRELAPVLGEFEQLQSVLAVLDNPETCRQLIGHVGVSPRAALREDPAAVMLAGVAQVSPLPSPRRLGSKPGADGRAPQGANKQRILAVIAEHPGIAAPQIAKLTGLKRPVVASTISRLKRTGELRAHGEGVCMAQAVDATVLRLTGLGAPERARAAPRLYSATGSG